VCKGAKGANPETIARLYYTFFILLDFPAVLEAKTNSSRAPDSETKLVYLPKLMSSILTHVCAELTQTTEALWFSDSDVIYGILP
jgi:hypothetical protein